MTDIHPAERYTPCNDLWLVTAYFNPQHYRNRLENYYHFVEPIRRAGMNLITVELALEDEPFELEPGQNVLQIRGRDMLWQKERLLNLAIAHLPESARMVAWLDCDLLFVNPDWATETTALLKQNVAVQLFERAIWLTSGATKATDIDKTYPSFSFMHVHDPSAMRLGHEKYYGHPGFGWAFNCDLLKQHGLYDVAIVGGGDYVMARAMRGDLNSYSVPGMFRPGVNGFPARVKYRIARQFPFLGWLNKPTTGYEFIYKYATDWGQRFYSDVRGQISYTPGVVLHLWHGSFEQREYRTRYSLLADHRFDPNCDIRIGKNGCWEWSSDKPALHEGLRNYFLRRREDKL